MSMPPRRNTLLADHRKLLGLHSTSSTLPSTIHSIDETQGRFRPKLPENETATRVASPTCCNPLRSLGFTCEPAIGRCLDNEFWRSEKRIPSGEPPCQQYAEASVVKRKPASVKAIKTSKKFSRKRLRKAPCDDTSSNDENPEYTRDNNDMEYMESEVSQRKKLVINIPPIQVPMSVAPQPSLQFCVERNHQQTQLFPTIQQCDTQQFVLSDESHQQILIQFPSLLPMFDEAAFIRTLEGTEAPPFPMLDDTYKASTLSTLPEGLLGHIQIRKSGKVQLLLNGGMQFDIYEGVTPFCRQEAAAIVMEGKGKSRRAEEVLFLGPVMKKLVVSPVIESKHDSEK